MNKDVDFDSLVKLFEQTQGELQKRAARSVDIALVVRNWLFGWYIVEFEICGAERKALYGKKLISKLAEALTEKMGKGFSRRSLDQFRYFYDNYQKIGQTLSAQSLDDLFSQLSIESDALKKITIQLISRFVETGDKFRLRLFC